MASSSVWQRARDAEGTVPLFAAVFGMLLAGLMIPGSRDFPLDDAWIHLTYVRSLTLGDGMSYNPGDWETGFSSPLWVLLLSLWPIGSEPVVAVKLLGMLLHGASAWLGARLALELARTRASDQAPIPVRSLALLAGTLVASTPTLLQGATSGMEVPLASTLILGTCLCMLTGPAWAAGLLGFLSVLARPESLFVAGAFGVMLAALRRRGGDPWLAPIWGAGGAALALGTWSAYCLVVSGHPWPNTQYVKGAGGGPGGLTYVLEEVLPWQPWLVSLTGVVLLVLAVRREVRTRRYEVSLLLAAYVIATVAIAVTRPLHPGVLFYESRYFAPLAGLTAIALPFGLLGLRRWVAMALVAPVAIVTGLQVGSIHGLQREQEHDTHTLHTAVASFVADTLPADAVVAVEGAGAHRFFAPRTMTIVDLVGLNDRGAAHLHHDRSAKLCHFVGRMPTHMVIPAEWTPLFAETFVLAPITHFDDPEYTQTDPPRPLRVVVYEVRGVTEAWRSRCGVG